MSYFKNKTILKLYNKMMSEHPVLQKHSQQLFSLMSDIELPEPTRCGETYSQNLYIDGCGQVEVSWNIDALLKFIPFPYMIEHHTVRELLTLYDFSEPLNEELLLTTLPLGTFSHKSNKIYLAIFPSFPDIHIIDGNHRLMERIKEPEYVFECVILSDERVLDFLYPNSRKFAYSLYFVSNVVLGTPLPPAE